MTKILYNKKGVPLMAYGRMFFVTTACAPKNPISRQNLKARANEKAENIEAPKETPKRPIKETK